LIPTKKTVSNNDVITIAWHSYQIDPHAITQPLLEKMASRFGREQLAQMQSRLQEMGKRDGITFDAHRLVQLAKTKNTGGKDQLSTKVILEIMRMYFEEGGDIRGIKDLGLAAERAGIERGEAMSWLLNGVGTEDVRCEVEEARKLGIRGVPWYQFNGRRAVLNGAAEESAILRQPVLARESSFKIAIN
jgi:predicted DsbA family dithiol-disulfide isomerase